MATLPSCRRSASAMCLAASAAAALLSVAAVVTRDVAVDAGVERDHRDALRLGLLQQRRRGLAVQRGEADGVGLLVERVGAAS